jgi:hypothetical protein
MIRRCEGTPGPRDATDRFDRPMFGERDLEQEASTRAERLVGAEEEPSPREIRAPLPRRAEEGPARGRIDLGVDGRDRDRKDDSLAAMFAAACAGLAQGGDPPHNGSVAPVRA